ncbi:MAG: HlyC/CorC family transporter [Chloroflexi bacterium]|nr:HlyC/CorC family transporter [Chloroflexota bacterium]
MTVALIVALLILLNGLFVAAEFAIIGVRPTQLDPLARAGNREAQAVLATLRSPPRLDRYIAATQLGITLASLGLGMYGEAHLAHFVEPLLARWPGAALPEAVRLSLGAVIAVGLLTYLHVVLGEMVPKSLALADALHAALYISAPMRVAQTAFYLPVRLLNWAGARLLRLLRVPPPEGHARLYSPEELELLVSESAGVGLIGAGQEQMIHNIFDFGQRQAQQIMTPRPRVQAIPHDVPLPELARLLAESSHSRFPVYEGSLDNVIGILHLKDLIQRQARLRGAEAGSGTAPTRGAFDLRLLLRPAPAVPERAPVGQLLAMLKRQRSHMAVVLDEYGGTAGIVTLEDVVEKIMGEVEDEFDPARESLTRPAPGVLEAPGDYLLDDLRELLPLGAPEALPEVQTLGGLIMAELGRPPRVGDQVSHARGLRFTVLATDGLAVARARIEIT